MTIRGPKRDPHGVRQSPEVEYQGLVEAMGGEHPDPGVREHIKASLAETPQQRHETSMAYDWLGHLRHLQSAEGGGYGFDEALKIANAAADAREGRN